MKPRLLELLCCPACKCDLKLEIKKSEMGAPGNGSASSAEIIEGSLECQGCAKVYPITKGVPRFVAADGYVKNFSIQWNRLRKSSKPPKVNRALDQFQRRTDFDLSKVRGEWVLEAGCGAGRFVKILSEQGAEIVGVDLSYGIDEVFEFVGRRPNVHLVHASIFDLPFKEGVFDKIYSLGVLHHTPDTKKAFESLPRLLKVGGRIAIWVYSSHNPLPWKFGGYYRKITTRLPPRLLYYLCYLAVPMYYVYKIPVVGRLCQVVLRTDGNHPDRRFRVLNTFDYYAPKYQYKHRYDEVFGWFEEQGLENIRVLHDAVAVAGSRPRTLSQKSGQDTRQLLEYVERSRS